MSVIGGVHGDGGAAVDGEGTGELLQLRGGEREVRCASIGKRRGRGWSSPEDNGGGGARPKSVESWAALVSASGKMGPGRGGEGGSTLG
jgi:hypothetical protein